MRHLPGASKESQLDFLSILFSRILHSQWYDHVMHMADERIPKKMLEMKLRGRRSRGRPRAR
jgi:hypothetical protein